ncbi:MAG: hypothetical protein NTZ14_14455 [Hyphomicrobiales bacterium]|nr:hypothetical protein [Hyphomicrobiales bacterium]
MERRTFLMGLFGGLAATAIGPSLAEAATETTPTQPVAQVPATIEVAADDKKALDETDKEFSQYYYRRRRIVRRRVIYRRRYVRRVYYRRPVRRVYYRRPVRRVFFY